MGHKHYCSNRDKGCRASWGCNAPNGAERDELPYCSAQPMDDQLCDECRENTCPDCGAIDSLGQPHDADCEIGQQGGGRA